MDVQCEKCGTEYALDETLVGPSGTAVRCTSCGHVFKVFPSNTGAVPETWVLRQASGTTFPFDRLGVLQDWIAAGKVSVDDQISKSGGEWKRLGDIAEMKPFFDGARPSGPTPTSDGIAPAAGHPRHAASEHADTIRVSGPGAAVAPAAPASPGTNTAQYAAPTPSTAAAPQPAPVASSAPTIRASSPAAIPTAHAPTQPAPAPPVTSDAPTIRASAPAPAPAPAHTPAPAPAPAPQPAAPAAPASDPSIDATIPAAEAPTMSAPPAAPPAAPAAPPAAAPATAPEPDLSQVPAAKEEEGWDRGQGIEAEGPAWAEGGSESEAIDEDYDEDSPAPSRKVGRWIALFLVLALVAAAFYVFMYQREAAREIVSGLFGAEDEGRHQAFYLKGRESFLLDTEQAFKQADREYQKVLALREDHAPTLAALGEMYANWAQYTLDAEIDARVDAHAAAGEGAEPDLKEAERLHRDYEDRIAEATRWTQQALAVDPALPAAHLAMADIKRLSGEADAAKEHLDKARGEQTGVAPDYVEALLMIDQRAEAEPITDKLKVVVSGDPLLRAIYRRARVLAASGERDQAKLVLDKLFELNSDHRHGRALAARLEAGQAVALTVETSDTATADTEAKADAGPPPDEPTEVAKPTGGAGAGPRVAEGGEAPIGGGGSIDSMLQRAARAQENGRVGEASALFKQVLQRAPSNIDALSGMAYCYLDRGSKGQAISHFRRALGVNPRYGPALIGLAGVYKSQGQKAQALKHYKQYLSAHPSGRYATMAKVNAMQLEQALEGASDEQDTSGLPAPKDKSGETPTEPAPAEDKPPAETPPPPSGTGGSSPPPAGGGDPAPSTPPTPPAADPPADPAPPTPPSGT